MPIITRGQHVDGDFKLPTRRREVREENTNRVVMRTKEREGSMSPRSGALDASKFGHKLCTLIEECQVVLRRGGVSCDNTRFCAGRWSTWGRG